MVDAKEERPQADFLVGGDELGVIDSVLLHALAIVRVFCDGRSKPGEGQNAESLAIQRHQH
eukprot:scaffold2210_cov316-Pinguiococcus_pyrenoidosus.AAC.8